MSHEIGWEPLSVVIVGVFLGLSACASIPCEKPIASTAMERPVHGQPELGWWAARFKIAWPEGEDPQWHVGLLLAHKVVAPVLAAHEQEIVLWRFHRRAKRDRGGHQFSFIFYARPEVASLVYEELKKNEWLELLKKKKIVLEERYDDLRRIDRPRIEDTSDPNWSLVMRRSWPYFIMGASQTWLDQIGETDKRLAESRKLSGLHEQLQHYKSINQSIENLWQLEGGHAFLHHLNALFGYAPIQVYEKRLMSF